MSKFKPPVGVGISVIYWSKNSNIDLEIVSAVEGESDKIVSLRFCLIFTQHQLQNLGRAFLQGLRVYQ